LRLSGITRGQRSPAHPRCKRARAARASGGTLLFYSTRRQPPARSVPSSGGHRGGGSGRWVMVRCGARSGGAGGAAEALAERFPLRNTNARAALRVHDGGWRSGYQRAGAPPVVSPLPPPRLEPLKLLPPPAARPELEPPLSQRTLEPAPTRLELPKPLVVTRLEPGGRDIADDCPTCTLSPKARGIGGELLPCAGPFRHHDSASMLESLSWCNLRNSKRISSELRLSCIFHKFSNQSVLLGRCRFN